MPLLVTNRICPPDERPYSALKFAVRICTSCDGVDVLRTEHGARRTRARCDRAIHRHDVFVGAAAVDAETAVANAVGIEGADASRR